MGDIYIGRNEDGELTHSARGTTWSKDGASYIRREKKNGKWVYTYGKPGHTVSTRSHELSRRGGRGFTALDEGQYSSYESLKRQSVSAQRNIEKDPRYKVEAKAAYLKNKASRAARKNVAKGKKKVSEILSRLRKSSSSAAKIANRKYKAAQKAASSAATQVSNKRSQAKKTATNTAIKAKKTVINTASKVNKAAKSTANKAKKKIKNAVSVKETAYITDVSTGKRRPAPTDLFDNTSNKKKYKKQAKAQRHTKRVIAREQAIGKVKHTIKNARSGEVNGYYRNKTAKPVSKKVDKKNAGKKR